MWKKEISYVFQIISRKLLHFMERGNSVLVIMNTKYLSLKKVCEHMQKLTIWTFYVTQYNNNIKKTQIQTYWENKRKNWENNF